MKPRKCVISLVSMFLFDLAFPVGAMVISGINGNTAKTINGISTSQRQGGSNPAPMVNDVCIDILPYCALSESQCLTNSYVREGCKKTCNLCADDTITGSVKPIGKPKPVNIASVLEMAQRIGGVVSDIRYENKNRDTTATPDIDSDTDKITETDSSDKISFTKHLIENTTKFIKFLEDFVSLVTRTENIDSNTYISSVKVQNGPNIVLGDSPGDGHLHSNEERPKDVLLIDQIDEYKVTWMTALMKNITSVIRSKEKISFEKVERDENLEVVPFNNLTDMIEKNESLFSDNRNFDSDTNIHPVGILSDKDSIQSNMSEVNITESAGDTPINSSRKVFSISKLVGPDISQLNTNESSLYFKNESHVLLPIDSYVETSTISAIISSTTFRTINIKSNNLTNKIAEIPTTPPSVITVTSTPWYDTNQANKSPPKYANKTTSTTAPTTTSTTQAVPTIALTTESMQTKINQTQDMLVDPKIIDKNVSLNSDNVISDSVINIQPVDMISHEEDSTLIKSKVNITESVGDKSLNSSRPVFTLPELIIAPGVSKININESSLLFKNESHILLKIDSNVETSTILDIIPSTTFRTINIKSNNLTIKMSEIPTTPPSMINVTSTLFYDPKYTNETSNSTAPTTISTTHSVPSIAVTTESIQTKLNQTQDMLVDSDMMDDDSFYTDFIYFDSMTNIQPVDMINE